MADTLAAAVLEYMTTWADTPLHYEKVAREIAILHPNHQAHAPMAINQVLVRFHNKHMIERVGAGTYIYRSLSKEGTESVLSVIQTAAKEAKKKIEAEPHKPAVPKFTAGVAMQPLPTGFRANMVFKGVGIDSSGSAIVKDPDGRLYKLVVL